jgi:hypothetical protein
LVSINSVKGQPAALNIIDANGKRIYSASLSLSKGINKISKPMYLSSGVYYANLTTGNEKVSTAFIRE